MYKSVKLLSCLVLLRHHDNIQRLWRGQESRLWRKRKKDLEIDQENSHQGNNKE